MSAYREEGKGGGEGVVEGGRQEKEEIFVTTMDQTRFADSRKPLSV